MSLSTPERRDIFLSDFKLAVSSFDSLVKRYDSSVLDGTISEEDLDGLVDRIINNSALDPDSFDIMKQCVAEERRLDGFEHEPTPTGDNASVMLPAIRLSTKIDKDEHMDFKFKLERVRQIFLYWPRYVEYLNLCLRPNLNI